MIETRAKTINVLLVEDDAGDALMTQEAFEHHNLLDLNLPLLDGHEVPARVKSDDDLKAIPVVMLTTSDSEEDVLRGYHLHADAYVTEPVDFEAFTSVIRKIDDFFVAVVRLPV